MRNWLTRLSDRQYALFLIGIFIVIMAVVYTHRGCEERGSGFVQVEEVE